MSRGPYANGALTSECLTSRIERPCSREQVGLERAVHGLRDELAGLRGDLRALTAAPTPATDAISMQLTAGNAVHLVYRLYRIPVGTTHGV